MDNFQKIEKIGKRTPLINDQLIFLWKITIYKWSIVSLFETFSGEGTYGIVYKAKDKVNHSFKSFKKIDISRT